MILPFVAFADLHDDPLVAACIAASDGNETAAVDVARLMFGQPVGLTAALAERVLASVGPFARAARAGLPAGDGRVALAARELAVLEDLAAVRVPHQLERLDLAATLAEAPAPATADVPPAFAARCADLTAGSWSARVDALTHFYRTEGTGPLATFRVLRFGPSLVGVPDPDPLSRADLRGDASRWAPLERALSAFAGGGPAVDALLFGPPGTGKSATVRALAHAQPGLRLIQVERDHLHRVPDLFRDVAGEGPRCLVLLDDLVFDAGGRGDRALRAALEGDVGHRPDNVCVWATSNRMRLIQESHAEREDDVEQSLGRGERAALASRFALRVSFPERGLDEWMDLAGALWDATGRPRPAGWEGRLRRFAREQGTTPRTAHQAVAVITAEQASAVVA